MSSGDARIRAVAGVPASTLLRLAGAPPVLVITDFDGTLAPIVPDPPAATILPAARAALGRLVELGGSLDRPTAIAVLSGRDAADVARRVGVTRVQYLGQHGIEERWLVEEAGGEARVSVATDPVMAAHGRALEAAADRVAARLGRPEWLVIEPKGASVGLHYRRADDPDAARSALLAAVDEVGAAPDGPRLVPMESRRVVELRPADAFGKGEATRRLIETTHAGSVLIMGDDRTDAEAFETVRRWRTDTGRPALVVGVSGAHETPPEILELADILVPDPAAAAAVLAGLADVLEAASTIGD